MEGGARGGSIRMRLTRHRTSPDRGSIVNASAERAWTWAIVLAALALIFMVDRATAVAPVQHLYYIPIILASVRFGFRGSLVAAAAIVLYHLANPKVITFRYEESDIVQIALFIAVGLTAAKLANDSRRLHKLATTDDLTGLHNLRSFEAHLRMLMRVATRRALPIALLVLDLDRLKSLNDTHGHLAGAEAVRTVGQTIAEHLPAGAVACRYGGDEFVIALPDCDEARALIRRRQPAARRPQPGAGAGGRVVSGGNAVHQRRDFLFGDDAPAGHAAGVTLGPFLLE